MVIHGEVFAKLPEHNCQKDETLSHVPLFKQIFRSAIKELFGGVVPERVNDKAIEIIKFMTDVEYNWTKVITRDVVGFSDRVIRKFVEGQANSVARNLALTTEHGYGVIYPDDDKEIENNPLRRILLKHLPAVTKDGDVTGVREGVFGHNVTDYNKNGMKFDF